MHRSARAAGDYTGAMLAGGRWNQIGVSMLYKSQLPRDYVWSLTELTSSLELLQAATLNHIASCQEAGRRWLSVGVQLAVRVRSVVIPEEHNILLNPNHSGYPKIMSTSVVSIRPASPHRGAADIVAPQVRSFECGLPCQRLDQTTRSR